MTFLTIDGPAEALLTIINAAAALLVLWTSICTLNFMTPRTPPGSRLAYIFLGVGAAAMLLGPVYFEHKPTVGGTVMATGVALLLIVERLYTRKLLARYADRQGQPRRPWWG